MVLPFGLATVLRLLTKLLKPLASLWQSQGINICINLDNQRGNKKLILELLLIH